MLKKGLLAALLFLVQMIFAQETPYKLRKILPGRDTIRIDSVSINKVFFKLQYADGSQVDTTDYRVDFSKSILVFREGFRLPIR